jgi:hypothetical protein
MIMVLGPVEEIVAPSVDSRAAVDKAVFCRVTKLPAATLASEPLAAEIVTAPKVACVTEYCKVLAVPLLAVIQTDIKCRISIGPPATVKIVSPLTITAAALSTVLGE